jgi:hypothetical protein
MRAREMHPREVHAYEVYAHEVHVYEMRAREVHAYQIQPVTLPIAKWTSPQARSHKPGQHAGVSVARRRD